MSKRVIKLEPGEYREVWTMCKAGFLIGLDQRGPDDFQVRYGLQCRKRLNYSAATMELGSAIMHALACNGELDNAELDV